MKKRLLCYLLSIACVVSITACGRPGAGIAKSSNTITVLNYGKYFDEDALKAHVIVVPPGLPELNAPVQAHDEQGGGQAVAQQAAV